jgi:acetoin utilization deacetylase AcuC-like enzyme
MSTCAQGNGNAVLFQEEPRVTTASFHCSANLFSERQTSDLDVDFDSGCTDEVYMDSLSAHIPRLFREFKPEITFFQAGVDPLGGDRLGRMQITREGLKRRNELVYEEALRSGGRWNR